MFHCVFCCVYRYSTASYTVCSTVRSAVFTTMFYRVFLSRVAAFHAECGGRASEGAGL